MREPWETLLGQYHDHWLLARYLDGDQPDVHAIQADDRWYCLSSGEQAMVLAADAMLHFNRALIGCLESVDETNQARIRRALRIAADV